MMLTNKTNVTNNLYGISQGAGLCRLVYNLLNHNKQGHFIFTNFVTTIKRA